MNFSTITNFVFKISAFFLSFILLLLPVVYSLDTQQIFSVNKFIYILYFTGFLGILFSGFYFLSIFFKNSKSSKLSLKIFKNLNTFSKILFCIFFAFLAISTYFSATPIVSFFGSDARHFGMLLFLVLFLVFLFVLQIFSYFANKNIKNKHKNNSQKKIQNLEKFIKYFIFIPIALIGLVSAVWAILQFWGKPPVFEDILNFKNMSLRSFAGMGQPNFLAQFLIFPFFVSLYPLLEKIKENKKSQKNSNIFVYFSVINIIIYLFAFIATGSRAGMLGVLAGGFFLFTVFIFEKYIRDFNSSKISTFLKKFHNLQFLHISVVFIILGILVLNLLIFFYGDIIADALAGRGESIKARFYFWNAGVSLLLDFFTTGTGFDMMRNELAQVLSVQALEPENFSAIPDRTHTFLLGFLLQMGVVPFILFIFGIYKTIYEALKNIIKSFDFITIIALSGFIGILSAWSFGFPVLVDSFFAIIFIAIIWRNVIFKKPLNEKQVGGMYRKYLHYIVHIFIFLFSVFLLFTASAIKKSEVSLFTLSSEISQNTISRVEKEKLYENIINTPYLENNIITAQSLNASDSQNSEIFTKKVLELGDKYHYQNSGFYRLKIEESLKQRNKHQALFFYEKLKKLAGNSFPQKTNVASVGVFYKLITPSEYQQEKQNIIKNYIPAYYFEEKNKNDKKYKKFWNYHQKEKNTLNILLR